MDKIFSNKKVLIINLKYDILICFLYHILNQFCLWDMDNSIKNKL